jgi:hypothetical protein
MVRTLLIFRALDLLGTGSDVSNLSLASLHMHEFEPTQRCITEN